MVDLYYIHYLAIFGYGLTTAPYKQPLVLSTSRVIPFINIAQVVRFMVVEFGLISTLDRISSRSQPCSRDLVKLLPWSNYLSTVHNLNACIYHYPNAPSPTHFVVMVSGYEGFSLHFPYGGDLSVTWSRHLRIQLQPSWRLLASLG